MRAQVSEPAIVPGVFEITMTKTMSDNLRPPGRASRPQPVPESHQDASVSGGASATPKKEEK